MTLDFLYGFATGIVVSLTVIVCVVQMRRQALLEELREEKELWDELAQVQSERLKQPVNASVTPADERQ